MERAVGGVRALLTDWRHFRTLSTLLLLGELALGVLVLKVLPSRYTEIDWMAYMQEVEGWLGGELDYTKLRGDTGPLVYPAGFVYAYSGLRWLVGDGGRGPAAIAAAQWVFLGVYLATQALVLDVYRRTKPGPPWVVLLLALSKRLHSLYYLRLFNDCLAMLAVYAAVLLCQRKAWLAGTLAWSAGVSVKMNGLLLTPALGLLLLRNVGVARTTAYMGAAVALQAALGAPFLAAHPVSYLSKAFELSRVFFWKWTVNWKFLPEALFVSPAWAKLLLGAHVAALLALAHYSWFALDGGLTGVLAAVLRHARRMPAPPPTPSGQRHKLRSRTPRAGGSSAAPAEVAVSEEPSPAQQHAELADEVGARKRAAASSAPGAFSDSPGFIAWVLLSANFAGIVFARTLHYQFFAWYAHALPLLAWRTDLHTVLRLAALAVIEWAFNVGDAEGAGSPLSSAALTSAHLLLLSAVLFANVPHPRLGTEEARTYAKAAGRKAVD